MFRLLQYRPRSVCLVFCVGRQRDESRKCDSGLLAKDFWMSKFRGVRRATRYLRL